MEKQIFSGHETFKCKTHWLKRGYDFIYNNGNFNDVDAVVSLGVGKNMVSSIKYWMKAFEFIDANNELTDEARYLLDDETGKDPFFEDMGTLWLLHFFLIHEYYATLYRKTFIDFHKHRNEITKSKLQNYIKATCFEGSNSVLYNETTIKKDIDVLLHNYCGASNESIEEKNTLFLPLNLIRKQENKNRKEGEQDAWVFNYISQDNLPAEIFLYSLLTSKEEGANSISFDLLQELSLIFCLDNNELLNIINKVCLLYPSDIIFSDNAGIKELQFRREFCALEILNLYYEK